MADYVARAGACISEVQGRGKVPIVAGGTGLYLSSLVEGLQFTGEKADPAVRQRLQAELEAQGIGPLYERLQRIDPPYAATLHKNNHGRVLRALELYEQTGKTMSWQLAHSRPPEKPYDALVYLSLIHIYGGDPMTVEEPAGGCSGSCSSCSGCH